MLKKYFFLLAVLCCVMFSNCTQPKPAPVSSNHAKAESTKSLELKYPVRFLKLAQRAVIRPVYVEIKKNELAIHKGYQLTLTIKNTANFVSYENINVTIIYLSKNREVLGKESFLIKKSIRPQETVKLSQKINKYEQTNYSIQIISASAKTL